MRLFNYLAAGCLALACITAQAETVSGLYQVREPLEGQGAEARSAATGKAFDTLVLRLTGDAKAVQSPALAALRKDPQQIINQVGTEAGPPESVLVEFDPKRSWWPMPSSSKALIRPRCDKPPSATAPMPCWRCMPTRPMANGKVNGSCGCATGVSRAMSRALTRRPWRTLSCWR